MDLRVGIQAIADFEGDGAAEIVGSTALWSQTADGGWEDLVRYSTNGAAAYDLDGDGMLDVITRESTYVVYIQVAPKVVRADACSAHALGRGRFACCRRLRCRW